MDIGTIGIVGLGDMGKLYAKALSEKGYSVVGCDLPTHTRRLRNFFKRTTVKVFQGYKEVADKSDWIIFSVPLQQFDQTVQSLVPFLRKGTLVSGQSAVKTLEASILKKQLPRDTPMVLFHALHGPSLSPAGQGLVLIPHHVGRKSYQEVKEIFFRLGSRVIEIKTAKEHDQKMADIQTSSHLCFQSMGTAWMRRAIFPWKDLSYASRIDQIKAAMMLRIFSGKAHVYGDLAMMNPYAVQWVKQYARSTKEIFRLTSKGKENELRQRVEEAGRMLFRGSHTDKRFLKFLGCSNSLSPLAYPNSHLSLIAMVDSWYQLGIEPHQQLALQTPPYSLRLAIAETVVANPPLLQSSLKAAMKNRKIQQDDEFFCESVAKWAKCIQEKDAKKYNQLFTQTKGFFKDHLEWGLKESNQWIGKLQRGTHRE